MFPFIRGDRDRCVTQPERLPKEPPPYTRKSYKQNYEGLTMTSIMFNQISISMINFWHLKDLASYGGRAS